MNAIPKPKDARISSADLLMEFDGIDNVLALQARRHAAGELPAEVYLALEDGTLRRQSEIVAALAERGVTL